MQPATLAHGSGILDTPFAQISQLGLLFIAHKPLASAISRKSNANLKFSFSHMGKNSMLAP
jgi:hypothetical protein